MLCVVCVCIIYVFFDTGCCIPKQQETGVPETFQIVLEGSCIDEVVMRL